MLLCQCYYPPPAGRRRIVNSVSTSIIVSTSIKFISTSIKLADSSKWQKSRFQVCLQEKWLFGCFWIRSRIRAFNKLSEAEQLLDLSQYIFLFALHHIFALHQFSSSIWHCKLVTGSDLVFAVSAYRMGTEVQKHYGLSRACLLPVSCQDGHPKDRPTLAKMFS